MVSAGILLIGLLAAAAILLSSGRRQERAANRIKVGDDSTAVVALLGQPGQRCAPGSMAHLTERFPGGTPRLTIENMLGRFRVDTAARWVYPDDEGGGCAPDEGDVEVGIDRNGKVLWLVPRRKNLVAPEVGG